MDVELYGMLTRLIALSPEGSAAVNALVRTTCAEALSLPPLPAEGAPADDAVLADFAEPVSYTHLTLPTTPYV